MRIAVLLFLAASLAACGTDPDPVQPTSTVGDVASYDAIRQASQACTAGGGQLELRSRGNATNVSDYICRRRQGESR
jgi:hypothetical protein